MSSFFSKIHLNEELKEKLHSTHDKIVKFASERPLWQKITFGTAVISYVYLKYKWTALSDCGVEVIEPSLMNLGTMGQYFGTDTYVKWVGGRFPLQKK